VNERGRSGVRFGLNLPGQIIEPDSGPAHAARCLRVLATWGEERPRDAMAEPHGTRKKQRGTTSQWVAEGQA
jgi:uncharacterized protein (DUF58 family)